MLPAFTMPDIENEDADTLQRVIGNEFILPTISTSDYDIETFCHSDFPDFVSYLSK